MIMENYLPQTEGAAFELTPTLSALAPFRDQVLVLSGLNCIPTPGRPGGAHAKATTRFLTDVSPPTSETWLDAGISMDQILAQETGKHTQVASLELAMESGETAGACDTGFACPYTNTISWKSANTPLPTQNNPRVDLRAPVRRQRQHRSESAPQPAAAAAERARFGDARRWRVCRGRCPPRDRTKLTEYLDAVRDVERRIQIAEEQSNRELPLVDHPVGIPANWEDARQADVRPAGAGLPVRPHARHHDDDGPRAQRHDLSADRRARRASPDLAPPAGTRERWPRSPRSSRIT